MFECCVGQKQIDHLMCYQNLRKNDALWGKTIDKTCLISRPHFWSPIQYTSTKACSHWGTANSGRTFLFKLAVGQRELKATFLNIRWWNFYQLVRWGDVIHWIHSLKTLNKSKKYLSEFQLFFRCQKVKQLDIWRRFVTKGKSLP